jgi:ATP-dependent Clp protease ATP-binding subunit ClpB
VILFDEIEKAHPDVFNALLQVLDEGRLTDGQGRTVDFKNTVLVMTSNLGSQMIQSMAGSDYQVVKLAVMGEVKTHFRPEFVNRIDEIVVFHALGEEHIKSIAKIQLNVLKSRLAKMDYNLEVSDAALSELAKVGFDPVYGARPLKRAIQSELENPLAKAILEGRFAPKDTIVADWKGGRMVFEKKTTARRAAKGSRSPRSSHGRPRSARDRGRRASRRLPRRPVRGSAWRAAAARASRCR